MARRSASHQPESIFYSFPTGGMSMGGAEATAPPIFSRETFANIQAQRLKKSCIITCESRIVTENSHEKTFAYHVFVRHSWFAIQPATLFVPSASAAAVPAAASKSTKKTKHKNRKLKILKGRHGKHSRKPA